MTIPCGSYRTAAGSKVIISGAHCGIAWIEFDWFEEPVAYIDCHCEAYPEEDRGNYYLVWHCEWYGSGRAQLQPIQEDV